MPGTGHRYPMNRRLGRPPDSLEDLGKNKNLLPLPAFKARIVKPVA